jgi:hypothetical protein
MSVDKLQVVNRLLATPATTAETGHRDPVLALPAPDLEWVTPQRVLRGIDQVRGDGRIVVEVHEIYRLEGSGEFAYARDRRIGMTIGIRKVVRYEMRIVG